ncbi:hypothetical protein ACIPZF_21295 [Pseudomonas sp. NPDC089752]|uniref:hypothetical protein n=1 Tax=Pseudomonas sp. NPDC089752 TaxID=3364472 RepID=UPI0038103118
MPTRSQLSSLCLDALRRAIFLDRHGPITTLTQSREPSTDEAAGPMDITVEHLKRLENQRRGFAQPD